jgi:release factor glutamine methyltransferase
MIYEPAEDSYLMSQTIEEHLPKIKNKEIRILDLGAGSGIQSETCEKLGFYNILTSDINPNAVRNLKKLGFKSRKSDLFSKIPEKFDLIIFNPPYLPGNNQEPEDSKIITTAGKKGYEIIIRFIKQAREHLTYRGNILLLISSLSKPKLIKKRARELGFNLIELKSKKLFFEEIYTLRLSLEHN